MAKRRSKVNKAAEDLLASLLAFSSGAIRNQARMADRDAKAYKPGKWNNDKNSGSGSSDSGGGDSNKVIADFIKKLIALLTPAALIATILASQASGMSVFFNSVKILGNTLGSVLLPVVMLGSAAILTLSDVINSNLMPNLEKWYSFILTGGVELIDKLDKAATDLINSLNGHDDLLNQGMQTLIAAIGIFHDAVAKVSGALGSIVKQGAVGIDNPVSDFFYKTQRAAKIHGQRNDKDLDILIQASQSSQLQSGSISNKLKNLLSSTLGPGNGLGTSGGLGEAFRKNLKLSVEEFRFQNAPKSAEMGIADAARNAQLAAFQKSPFEQKMEDNMQIIIDTLEKAVDKLTPGAGR